MCFPAGGYARLATGTKNRVKKHLRLFLTDKKPFMPKMKR
jgi:hypothetical protein